MNNSMNKKIEQFVKRNRYRNNHLYGSKLTEGIDYIVCPVTKERLSMIKKSYIERVLGMTVEHYDELYPGIRGVSVARKDNIKKGLKQVDPISGKTKYQLAQEKAKNTLSKLDEFEVSGYKRKGQKTRETHLKNIDKFGRNGYRRQADARLTTILPNGLTVEQNAHIKQKRTLIKNIEDNKKVGRRASKSSIKFLTPIIELMTDNNIKFYFNETKFGIKDPSSEKHFFFDLTITELSIAIEFQSSAWHSNPSWDDTKWNNWCPPCGKLISAADALAYDYYKARVLYETRGITTYYVWEDTALQDVKDIICLLKTLITKS
jgi:hypothetical protein